MSRSVDYLNNAKTVIFFTVDWVKEDYDYEDFESNLLIEIKNKLKSYINCKEWDGREVKIILENELCNIGISEYYGCWSLSVAPQEEEYYAGYNIENLGINHAIKIKKTLIKCLENVGAICMDKLATFSNGEAVYELMKK